MQSTKTRNTGKKRIMLVVPMLDQGGLERVCALTGQLLKKEYEVHLVVFNTEGMIYDVSGVHLIDLHLGAVESKIGKIVNVYKRTKAVRKLKKQHDIQLTYSFGPTANIVNVLSKGKDITWIGIRGYGALSDKRRMQFTCKRADRVISCTKVMEQDINREFATKSSATLYNPCDIDSIHVLSKIPVEELTKDNTQEKLQRIKEFINRPGKLIVSTGRSHDVKGFWHLIKSVALLKKELPDTKLMIIGAGDYSEYKKLATDLGIEKDVLFTGVQKNPFALMEAADLYALTSDSEGFPNALIEAMACGLPCVSVNCKTGPAEILGEKYQDYENQQKTYDAEYGILTPVFVGEKNLDAKEIAKEEEIFAKEMCQILKNQDKYRLYQSKSIVRARFCGTEQYYKNISDLIEQEIE